MRLTEVIEVWDRVHVLDTGEVGFCDLEKAIDEVVGVENDVPGCQPSSKEISHGA